MRTRNAAGFTLIELMVVVIIIAALAAMILPHVMPASTAAKRKITRAELASIGTALQNYRLFSPNNRYPTTQEGLDALLRPPLSGDWREPFLTKKPIDQWGNSFQYRCPGTHNRGGFDLWSLGPDGKDGTEDDITNWQD